MEIIMNQAMINLFESDLAGYPATSRFSTFYALLSKDAACDLLLDEYNSWQERDTSMLNAHIFNSLADVQQALEDTHRATSDYVLLTADNTLADSEPAVYPATSEWIDELASYTEDEAELDFLSQLRNKLPQLTKPKTVNTQAKQNQLAEKEIIQHAQEVVDEESFLAQVADDFSGELATQRLISQVIADCEQWHIDYRSFFAKYGLWHDEESLRTVFKTYAHAEIFKHLSLSTAINTAVQHAGSGWHFIGASPENGQLVIDFTASGHDVRLVALKRAVLAIIEELKPVKRWQ